MEDLDDLAERFVALIAPVEASDRGLERFAELHRIIFNLRHLPLTLTAGIEEPSQLSDLPTNQAELLLQLVRQAGPADASVRLFIAAAAALARESAGPTPDSG